jgi:hypothetical protein
LTDFLPTLSRVRLQLHFVSKPLISITDIFWGHTHEDELTVCAYAYR